MKIDATHSILPWIAEHAGFLLTRFEVVRDGRTAYERLNGKSAKVQGVAFAEGTLWKSKRAGGPLGKLTCMWEDGIQSEMMGKWLRTDGNKRKAGEVSEESRLRKTVRYLKELDKMENKKESGET